MVSVEITRSTIAGGKRVVVGETIDLTEADARSLIAMGKAVPVIAGGPVPETRDPVADNREKDVEKKTSRRNAAKKTD